MVSEAIYRYEVSKTSRASCQVQACKDAGAKIQKGEFRFGTLVTIKEHTGWKWKHWGCVTPKQIENIVDQLGGLEGLDLDKDLDILDGYDELEPWAQEKLRRSLEQGHVDDEDWKGDPEKNRPGMKGVHTKVSKAQLVSDVSGGSDAEQTPKKRAKKDGDAVAKKKSKKRKIEEDESEEEIVAPKKSAKKKVKKEGEGEDEVEAPKKNSKKKVKNEEEDDDDDDGEVSAAKRKTKTKTKKVKEEDAEDDDDKPLPAKGKVKKAAVKQEDEDEMPALPAKRKATKTSKSAKVTKSKTTAKPKLEEESEDELNNAIADTTAGADADGEDNEDEAGRKPAMKKTKAKKPNVQTSDTDGKRLTNRPRGKKASNEENADAEPEPNQGRRRSGRSRA